MTGRDQILEAENEIRVVLDQMRQAMHDRDAKRYYSHFVPGAMEYDLAPPLGHEIDPKELGDWMNGWDGPIDETPQDIRIEAGSELAFAYGMARVDVKRGGEDIVWWMRRTTCLRKTSAGWKVVHDHTSEPFYMDGSLRAATDLEPV